MTKHVKWIINKTPRTKKNVQMRQKSYDEKARWRDTTNPTVAEVCTGISLPSKNQPTRSSEWRGVSACKEEKGKKNGRRQQAIGHCPSAYKKWSPNLWQKKLKNGQNDHHVVDHMQYRSKIMSNACPKWIIRSRAAGYTKNGWHIGTAFAPCKWLTFKDFVQTSREVKEPIFHFIFQWVAWSIEQFYLTTMW